MAALLDLSRAGDDQRHTLTCGSSECCLPSALTGASSAYESMLWLCVMLHFLDTLNMMQAIHARVVLAHTALYVAGASSVRYGLHWTQHCTIGLLGCRNGHMGGTGFTHHQNSHMNGASPLRALFGPASTHHLHLFCTALSGLLAMQEWQYGWHWTSTHHEGSRISDASSLSALIGPASTHHLPSALTGASSTYEAAAYCIS
jgi:hypothetical protein